MTEHEAGTKRARRRHDERSRTGLAMGPAMGRNDLTVHAITATGAQVVHADGRGQWFLHEGEHRRRISLGEAVALACAPGARAITGVRGGGSFDVGVRRHQRLAAETQPVTTEATKALEAPGEVGAAS